MAENIVNVRVQNKYDKEANWKAKDPVLLSGEVVFTSDGNDMGKHKVGNGTAKWSELPYSIAELSKGDVITALGYTPPTTYAGSDKAGGSATSAKKLETARKINGAAFDGTGDITTTTWGTARNITIGNTKKSVNGSADIAWTLAEIGAAYKTHNHTVEDVGLLSENEEDFGINLSNFMFYDSDSDKIAMQLGFLLSDKNSDVRCEFLTPHGKDNEPLFTYYNKTISTSVSIQPPTNNNKLIIPNRSGTLACIEDFGGDITKADIDNLFA